MDKCEVGCVFKKATTVWCVFSMVNHTEAYAWQTSNHCKNRVKSNDIRAFCTL